MTEHTTNDLRPRSRWGRASVLAVVGAAVLGLGAFSASEAWAARSALFTADCGEYNWCREGPGAGDANYWECCGNDNSICLFYDDIPSAQGCLCAG
jgi:hypothetical protein